MDGYVEFEIASTGYVFPVPTLHPLLNVPCSALLTLDIAIPHLNHFCAVIPSGGPDSHVPIYELDPPEYFEGWHEYEDPARPLYTGPWGATVILPRALPPQYVSISEYGSFIPEHRVLACGSTPSTGSTARNGGRSNVSPMKHMCNSTTPGW